MTPYNPRGYVKGATRPIEAHLKRLLRDRDYRALQRLHRSLRKAPRFVPGSFDYAGLPVRYVDAPSALNAFDEIFVNRIYDIGNVANPHLVDVGANIGLAALYFRRRYRSFTGVCFEPDPAICDVLRQNLNAWGCTAVDVHQAAAGSADGQTTFHAEGADGGRVVAETAPAAGSRLLTVQTLRLSRFLDRPVDLLKIDVEGAELDVLREARPALANVRRCFVEIHSYLNEPQAYWEVFQILQQAGFRCYPQELVAQKHPFAPRAVGTEGQFDLTLNVFAVRPGT